MSAGEDRRDGAIAVLQALHRASQMASVPDEQTGDYFHRIDAAIADVLATIGPLSPKAAGAIGVLAELAVESVAGSRYSPAELLEQNDAGTWMPMATMRTQEIEAARRDFAEDVAAHYPAHAETLNLHSCSAGQGGSI